MIYGDDRLAAAIDRRNKMYAPKYLDAVRMDVVVNTPNMSLGAARPIVWFVEGTIETKQSAFPTILNYATSRMPVHAAIKCGFSVSSNQVIFLSSGHEFIFGDPMDINTKVILSPPAVSFMLQLGATLYFSRVRAIADNGSLWEPVFRNSVLYRAVLMPNDFVIETYPFSDYIKARTVQPNVVEITFPEPLWWDARTVFFVTLPFNVPEITTQTVGSINLLDCVII